MWASNKTRNFLLLSLWALQSASAGEVKYNPGAVLVIDEAADLSHPRLQKTVVKNTLEFTGRAGVDDDANGFVDDVAGWNAISNDAQYMPEFLMKWFVENAETVKYLLDLFSRTVMNDEAAIAEIVNNPQKMHLIQYITTKSHGTHVAGIVSKGGQGAALVQNLNVFTGSEDPEMNPSTGITAADRTATKQSIGDLTDRIRERARPQADDESFKSAFDDKEAITEEFEGYKKERDDEMNLISRFLLAHGHGVANLSLGTSRKLIWGSLESQWQKELKTQEMPWNTVRTKIQEENFQFLANAIYDSIVEGWHNLFKSHKNVLFVVAAGNDGKDISVWENECTPAEAGALNKNVLTVAATDESGTITDFSNYGRQQVAMAARGQAVRSLAPNNMEVLMDGTSMASPFVAALAARVRTINPALNAVQVRMLLENTGLHVNSLEGKVRNSSIIDPEAALAAAEESKPKSGGSIEAVVDPNKRSRDQLFPGSYPLDGFKFRGPSKFRDRTKVGDVKKTPDIVKQILFGR